MPFGQRGSAIFFEGFAAGEIAFEIEVIVDRGVNGGEFLLCFDVPKIRHHAFSLPERLARILGLVVEPAPAFLIGAIPDHIHRCAIRPEPVRHKHLRLPMPLHCTLQKLKRSPAIPPFGHKNFKYFALVVDGTPEARIPSPTHCSDPYLRAVSMCR